MEGGQAKGGDGDHDAVQDDEVGLVLHDGVPPSVGHLSDTEDATDEDGKVGDKQTGDEDLELRAV